MQLSTSALAGGEVLLSTDARGQFTAHDPLNNGSTLLSFKSGAGAAPHSLVQLGGITGPPLLQCAAGSGKPLLQTWWTGRPEDVRYRQVLPGAVNALAVSVDGRYLAAALTDQVWLWQTSSGMLIAMLSGPHNARVTQLIFTDPLTFLISAGEDGVIAVWPLWRILTPGGGGEVRPIHTWSAALCPVYISILGRAAHCAVLTAARSGAITVYSVLTGHRLTEVVVEQQLHCIVTSSCGAWAVAGSDQGLVVRVKLIESSTSTIVEKTAQKMEEMFERSDGAVVCVALSTLSTHFAAGSTSGRVALATFPGLQRLCWLGSASNASPITNLLFSFGLLGEAALRGGQSAIEGQPVPLQRQLQERPAELLSLLLPEQCDDHEPIDDENHIEIDYIESKVPSNASTTQVDSALVATLREELSRLHAANKRLHNLSVLAVASGTTEAEDCFENVAQEQLSSPTRCETTMSGPASWQLHNSVHRKRSLFCGNKCSPKATPRQVKKRAKRSLMNSC